MNEAILYHYCNLEAFLNIVQNSTIWLSDISKSNDLSELSFCKDKIDLKIKQYLAGNKKALKAWEAGREMALNINEYSAIYVICFTENRDLLSQWRNYADDAKGIAIGFSKSMFEQLSASSTPYGLSLCKVLYDEIEQEKIINPIVEETIQKMSDKGVGKAALELDGEYCMKYPICKQNGFFEEKEWRIIVNSAPNKKVNLNKSISISEAHYRIRNDQLVSYLEMDFSKMKQQAIKEIWIGPKAKVNKHDIMKLLLTYGYYDTSKPFSLDEPILIRKSTTSYT